MKKSLLAMSVLLAAGSVSADPFYVDVNENYGPAGDQVCPTCTSMKDEFLFTYESSTTIFDTVNNNIIDMGDLLTTDGGLAVGGLANNQVTGFTPNEVFGANSNNGYGPNYLISFSVTGLNGVVDGVSGGVPQFTYGPGLLELFITFDGVTLNNFMDIAITGGGATGVSTILLGTADFTSVDAQPVNLPGSTGGAYDYRQLLHSGTTTCLGSDSFFDIWTNCGPDGLNIEFFASFDTNIFVSDFTYNPGPDTFTLTSDHDGSATFSVPEPGTLALLGGSLVLMGAMARRNKKA
ncbi:MAG: PEP-CTERM sorting domain-containing protein [Thiobacillus sp.]|nr:PEP-CTERM sorting domain-containing protein [Thiobacillus sp.]